MSRFFSNGTEGRAWEALWCQRCEHDHSMHDPENGEGGCIHLLHAMAGMDDELEGVWFDESERFGFTFPPAVRCAEFKSCASCGEQVTVDENDYPSPVRQREWIRPHGSTDPGVLITDRLLSAPSNPTKREPE